MTGLGAFTLLPLKLLVYMSKERGRTQDTYRVHSSERIRLGADTKDIVLVSRQGDDAVQEP